VISEGVTIDWPRFRDTEEAIAMSVIATGWTQAQGVPHEVIGWWQVVHPEPCDYRQARKVLRAARACEAAIALQLSWAEARQWKNEHPVAWRMLQRFLTQETPE
jgi:hypothetical protein